MDIIITEKYYSYKEEYKNISINVALKNSENSRLRQEESKKKLEKLEIENTKVSSALAKKNAAIESSKSSLIPYEKKLQRKQEDLNKILDKIRDHEEMIRIKEEKSKMLNEKIFKKSMNQKRKILRLKKQLAEYVPQTSVKLKELI